jgi:hypothetical protein
MARKMHKKTILVVNQSFLDVIFGQWLNQNPLVDNQIDIFM